MCRPAACIPTTLAADRGHPPESIQVDQPSISGGDMLHQRRETWSLRSRRVAGVSLLLGLVFGLLACGPAAPSAPTAAPASATSAPAPAATPTAAQPPAGATTAAVQPPASTTATQGQPKRGGSLV